MNRYGGAVAPYVEYFIYLLFPSAQELEPGLTFKVL